MAEDDVVVIGGGAMGNATRTTRGLSAGHLGPEALSEPSCVLLQSEVDAGSSGDHQRPERLGRIG